MTASSGEEVVEYLRDLVTALGQVLHNGKLEAKKSALRAIGSAASAAESAFEPYVHDLLPLLQHCMNTDKVSPALSVNEVINQACSSWPLSETQPVFSEPSLPSALSL